MENQIFFVIMVILIFGIFYIHLTCPKDLNENNENNKNNENFDVVKNQDDVAVCGEQGDLLTLNPYQRCLILGKKKFMIRDLRTKLWLISGQEEGFNKFLPGRFGVSLLMSEDPGEYLPLRTLADPNDYLLATYSGNGIRTVSNPNAKYFIIQVFIYNGYNVLGYINESNEQLYLYIDSDGHITSTQNPSNASVIEIIEI